jgi:preprotein translocase subunit SecG
MNLPLTPPTDSLYKFQAVSGVILLIASIVLPYIKAHEEDEITAQATQGVGIAQADETELATLASFLQQETEAIEHSSTRSSTTTNPATPQEGAQSQDGNINNAKEELRKLVELTKSVSEKIAVAKAQTDLEGDALRDMKYLNKQTAIMGIFGLFLWLIGSYNWHKHIQEPQNELLRLQVAKAKADVEAIKPSAAAKTKGKKTPRPEMFGGDQE